MGWLRELFGPSKEDVWRQLAAQVGGQYNAGGWFGKDSCQARVGDWIITLDTYTVSSGKSSTTYTRFRAPFINKDGFHFNISRADLLTPIGKFFGMQDIEIGDPFFDHAFVLKSNDPLKLGGLMANDRIRHLLLAQPSVAFQVQDDEGWFGAQFPQGVDQLHFLTHGVITDLIRLRGLYDLFAEVLNQLCHLDSAYQDDLALHMDTLRRPGGKIEANGLVLWDGELAKHRAVQALAGYQGNALAAHALLEALPGAGFGLRHDIIRALGHLGNPAAIPHLIPYLGGGGENPGYWGSTRAASAEALRALGQGETVEAFGAVLQRDVAALGRLNPQWKALFVSALRAALQSTAASDITGAALALVEWGVVEAVPDLRTAARAWREDPETRAVLDGAIQELERRSALPRPSHTPAPEGEALPVPAGEPEIVAGNLPRPGKGQG